MTDNQGVRGRQAKVRLGDGREVAPAELGQVGPGRPSWTPPEGYVARAVTAEVFASRLGRIPKGWAVCEACNGYGALVHAQSQSMRVPCGACGGNGLVRAASYAVDAPKPPQVADDDTEPPEVPEPGPRYDVPAGAYNRALRPNLPQPIPERMLKRPRDDRGYPVPFFVAWVDGVADFRVFDARRLVEAVDGDRCWLCGDKLGAYKSFAVGPMCVVNRVSSEPPSHRECAEWAARACPFLSRPKAERRMTDLPDGTSEPSGMAIKRNPGVTVVWTTKRHSLFRVEGDKRANVNAGVLFNIGVPDNVTFWYEGRPATRAEVEASIESGCPALRSSAEAEGPKVVAIFEQQLEVAKGIVSACFPG